MSPISREELEEQASIVIDTKKEYQHADDKEYFRPQKPNGIPDFELMLDVMGFTVGAIVEKRSEKLGDTRGIISERFDGTVEYVGEQTVERSGFRIQQLHAREGSVSWDAMHELVVTPEIQNVSVSTINWWRAYLDGRIRVIGNIGEVGGGWPVRDN